MRIIIISQYYYPEIGAASNRWTDYSRLLSRMGHEIIVICGIPNYPYGSIYKEYNKQKNKNDDFGVTVINTWLYISKKKNFLNRILSYATFMLSAIWTGLKLDKPDIYIVSSPPLFVGLSGVALSKIKNSPLLFDIRDLWPESAISLGEIKTNINKKIGYFIQKIIYKNSNAFIVAVPNFKTHLKNNKNSKNKIVLQLLNGVSDRSISKYKPLKKDNDKVTMIYAGTIGLAQDLEIIINAFSYLNKNIYIKIIGDGVNKNSIAKLADGNDRIQILNSMKKDDLIEEYIKSDIGIVTLRNLPIFKDALPSKTFEYMALGLAVLCIADGYLEKIINKYECGICSKPGDLEMLLEKINSINIDTCKKMGRNGQEYVKNHMNKNLLIREFDSDLESVINNYK